MSIEMHDFRSFGHSGEVEKIHPTQQLGRTQNIHVVLGRSPSQAGLQLP